MGSESEKESFNRFTINVFCEVMSLLEYTSFPFGLRQGCGV